MVKQIFKTTRMSNILLKKKKGQNIILYDSM